MKNFTGLRIAIFLFLFLLFGGVFSAFAQKDPPEILKIRQLYRQTGERIAEAEKSFPESEVFFSEMTVNKGGTMYPAVGNFKSVFSFYYTYGDREQEPYPNRLMKVTIKTERAANEEFGEYLFDEKGNLVFYFEKINDEPESRFYFWGGKIIRIQRGDKLADINSRAESAAPKAVQAQAAKVVGIFRNSIGLD